MIVGINEKVERTRSINSRMYEGILLFYTVHVGIYVRINIYKHEYIHSLKSYNYIRVVIYNFIKNK